MFNSADDSGGADLEETMSTCSDGEGELDATLPYSLPYCDDDNENNDDDDNVGYRVQWEPPNGFIATVETSDSESEIDDSELYTHKFVADRDPAPFSTSFVEYEEEERAEGEEEDEQAPEGPRPENLRVT